MSLAAPTGRLMTPSSLPAIRRSRSTCRCSTADGRVRLADFAGERPVALVFGSYT